MDPIIIHHLLCSSLLFGVWLVNASISSAIYAYTVHAPTLQHHFPLQPSNRHGLNSGRRRRSIVECPGTWGCLKSSIEDSRTDDRKARFLLGLQTICLVEAMHRLIHRLASRSPAVCPLIRPTVDVDAGIVCSKRSTPLASTCVKKKM